MSDTFNKLGIRNDIITALKTKKIHSPTDVQRKMIPIIMENKDVIVQSATGTGKTFGYLLPLFEKLDTTIRKNQCIILVPTHELAVQVNNQIDILEKNSETKLKGTVVVGKVNIDKQIAKLKEKPEIIVGTPGRILELIKKKKITAHMVKTIVIDEADRLIDDYSIDEVKAVIKTTMRDTQKVLVSASMSNKSIERASEILNNPEIIKEEKLSIPDTIEHIYFTLEARDKITLFRKLVRTINPTKAILFVNRTYDIKSIVEKLKYHGLNVEELSSDKKKLERKKVMDAYRKGKLQIIVSSDVAARGIDFEDVTHIFNFDLPERSETFLHRVGRTGRNGKSGVSISLATKREEELIKIFKRKFKFDITHKNLRNGQIE
jgi:superfamily II DNA/RNA helicase